MANILILKFPYSSTFGGGEKHTLQLVEQLQATKSHSFWLASSCSVLLPEFTRREWPAKKVWGGTEPVTAKALLLFLFTWPFILVNLLRVLVSYKMKHSVTIIYCLSLTEKVLLTPWARLLGIRVVWVEHLLIERWLLSSPLRFFYVLWSRLATAVTVVEAVKTQLVNLGVPAKNVQVIYNSVDTNHIAYLPTDPASIQQQFNVTFIGRIASEKGLADLLSATKHCLTTIPQIHLTIVGQGPWQAELEQTITDLSLSNCVTLAGFQTDIMPWLERAHVVVLPSTRRETFGIIIAEALAAGKPVITTTVGGVHEVVGDFGTIVAPNAPEQLASALESTYGNYQSALDQAKQGRQRILDEFNQTRMIHGYDTVFAQLA